MLSLTQNEPCQPSQLLCQPMCQHKEKPLERKLWQQGYRFSFQKNRQFVQAYSSVISECIAAFSPVRLNLRLKEVESKPKMQAKKMDICKGKVHNSWAYYPRWEWVVLHPCNTTCASHNPSQNSNFSAICWSHSTAALQQPVTGGWRVLMGSGRLGGPLAPGTP